MDLKNINLMLNTKDHYQLKTTSNWEKSPLVPRSKDLGTEKQSGFKMNNLAILYILRAILGNYFFPSFIPFKLYNGISRKSIPVSPNNSVGYEKSSLGYPFLK